MAGVMEAAFCALAIKEGFIPGNAHLRNPDRSAPGSTCRATTLAGSGAAPGNVLSTSSGFGGSNVCHRGGRVSQPEDSER
jgi:3-oxoacyl-[acyl-carrier-protein] synthase-1